MSEKNQNQEKVVLITGSSSGIGFASALAFAKAGFKTIATLRDKAKAQPLLDEAKQKGLSIDIRELDVCSEKSVANCTKNIISDYGRLDILLNNAGAGYRGTVEHTPFAEIESIMNVNFYGVVRMTQAVLPLMREAKRGHIITVSSLGGIVSVPFNEIYCAAKFAVEGMMEGLAPLAQGFGVAISLIEPGPVKTLFSEKLKEEGNHSSSMAPAYASMAQKYQLEFPKYFPAGPQSGDDIAKVILEAALSPNPRLRYVTSQDALKVASQKFVNINESNESKIRL